MPDKSDDAAARAERAKAIRQKINEAIEGGGDEGPEQGEEESDRDFVERRMREEKDE